MIPPLSYGCAGTVKWERLEVFERPEDGEQDILADEAIRLMIQYQMRGRDDRARPNKTHWDAETVSALYKSRWRIERFLKMIKQHLRIKTFIGTNRNAVMSQTGTAMIAALLLLHLKNKSNQDWYMSHLVAFIRIHLMSYIDMWGVVETAL